jgi:hypothetical protein
MKLTLKTRKVPPRSVYADYAEAEAFCVPQAADLSAATARSESSRLRFNSSRLSLLLIWIASGPFADSRK